MAAKAAIERAQNELARFVERKQARQHDNTHSFFVCIIYFTILATKIAKITVSHKFNIIKIKQTSPFLGGAGRNEINK